MIASTLPSKRIAVVVNGIEGLSPQDVDEIKKSQYIIAVDGGMNACDNKGIKPHVLIGDLDSVSPEVLSNLKGVEIVKLERAKDIADLEAGLKLAAKTDRAATICLFNALGGRLDHHLNNLFLMLKYPNTMLCSNGSYLKLGSLGDKTVRFYEDEFFSLAGIGKERIFPVNVDDLPSRIDKQEISIISPDNPLEFASIPGLTLSLIPWRGPAKGVKTTGLKWNLDGHELNKDFFSLSNIATEAQVSIKIESGALLCIVQTDIIDEAMIELVDHSSPTERAQQSLPAIFDHA